MLITCLEDYVAASGVPLKRLHTDNEFHIADLQSGEMQTWARKRGIAVTTCAPHTHVQNPKAERSVGLVKTLARKLKLMAATSDHLLPYLHRYCCLALNKQPTSSDPTGELRSPITMWPAAPYQHTGQDLHPWGCRAIGFVGKRTDNPNTAPRGRHGIYLGFASSSAGHLVYHEDSDSVFTYGYVDVIPARFPLKEMLLDGERRAADGALDPDGWRFPATQEPGNVGDRALAQFLVGKQIQFMVPGKVHDTPADWRVRAQRPTVHQATGLVGIEVIYAHYNGNLRTLPLKSRKFAQRLESGIYPLSPLPAGTSLPPRWFNCDVRSCLAATFPGAVTCSDFARLSVSLAGAFPTPAALETAQAHLASFCIDQCSAPSSCRDRAYIVLPCRHVGHHRSSSATWSPVLHPLLRTRTQYTSAASMHSSPSRQMPATALHLGFEPRSMREARQHESAPLWDSALDKEISGLEQRDCWTAVPTSSVPPGSTILDSKLVLTDKPITGPKVRLVVRGDQQWPKPPSSDTYAPTPSATEIRILLSTAAQNDWDVHSLDISQAFVQAHPLPPDVHIYVRPPRDFTGAPDTLWKLKRPLYGLATAPKAWSATLSEFITGYGFALVDGSSTLYSYSQGTDCMHLVYHVDDILLSFSSSSCALAFKAALLSRFAGTDNGPVSKYVGLDITRTASSLHLSQETLAREILDRFDMNDCNPTNTPMAPGQLLLEADRNLAQLPARTHRYQELVGCLQFLAVWTRPDLQFPTNELAKHMIAPGAVHEAAAKRVLRYLHGTAHLGLTYHRGLANPNRLIAYADADWASCTDTRRSVSGFVVFLNGAAVAWKSQKQGGVATSTSEAEFVSASKAADELVWERRLLAGLHLPQDAPTPLYEDNRACRLLSANPVHRERSKHIDYRVFALRDRVAQGHVRVIDCSTQDMIADSLTKNLPAESFFRHRNAQLGITPYVRVVA